MDFKLDKAHELQRELFRRFAETEIAPIAKDMDESEVFDLELVAKLQKYGFLGIPYSKEYGGVGADVLTYALCMEEVSKVDASTGITISVHTSLCCSCINDFGSEEQKQKFLRPLVDGSKIGCFSLTEPGAGSDVAGAQTVAVKDGDDYIITGSKVFTTNSGFADTFIVFALTDRSVPAAKGMSAFVVTKDMPGVEVSENIERMGIRAASNCIVTYDKVRVPKENMLSKEGAGFKIAMKALDGGRIGIAAQALGIAEGALHEAIEYTKGRVQFGKPISKFQNTQFTMADLELGCEAGRLLVYQAAVMKGEGVRYTKQAAMAKLFCSEHAMKTTTKAVQMFGGYGYTNDYPVERMMRDAKITEIYEGTSEVQRIVISANMGL